MDIPLSLTDVSKTFGGFTAVNKVSFAVPRGCIFGLLGGNGAGKTTTIRMILGILKPSGGEINLFGSHSAARIRHRIAYLPEERGLYSKMKVWKCACYFASLKGLDSTVAKQRAFEMLDKYGLGEFKNSKVNQLSKGMSQKLQLISTILHDPEFVILDEPFSGLDPVNQQALEELISDMASSGKTIIFSTHVMQHAERLCDRLLLMTRGNKVFEGTVDEAKGTLPHRILLKSEDEIAKLSDLPDIKSMAKLNGSDDQWEMILDTEGDAQKVLQACFDRNIRLSSFQLAEPSLHDVFVHLVGGHKDGESPT